VNHNIVAPEERRSIGAPLNGPDYREFVFTTTRKDTDVAKLDIMTLFDNMVGEIERLDALIELLTTINADDFEARHLSGVGLLLSDVRARMRTMLNLALKSAQKR
jgi:hypothetical protein